MLQCTCGMLHVSVGSVTVRMRPATAGRLRDGLAAALRQIEADELSASARPGSRGGNLPS